MVRLSASAVTVLLSCAFGSVFGADILQQDLASLPAHGEGVKRKLTGRFLQVSDFHPDRFYQVYSSTAAGSACHRGEGPTGYYGAETSECDSPVSLINATFDWIDKELKDSIDFVLWTGDSARHDNDEELPRSTDQVVSLNELMVQKFVEVFGAGSGQNSPDAFIVPVIPTLGNNDILPHNIFEIGPNRWTKTYLNLWRAFIPEEQRHQFDQGGWFSVEVIPNHLSVFSLNSLYFFDNNAAVDGCAAKSEPGYRQMEWLRIQLQFLRDRKMKAIIIGHVPPARTEGKHSWDETCWQKYTLWMQQYRDVIVGSMYGHMNIDHFIVQDFDEIDADVKKGLEMTPRSILEKRKAHSKHGEIGTQSVANYFVEMRNQWANLPKKPKSLRKMGMDDVATSADEDDDIRATKNVDVLVRGGKGGKQRNGKKHGKEQRRKKTQKQKEKKYFEKIGGAFGERFSISHVTPSVVPNYFPTIRIYEYNITGLEHIRGSIIHDEEDLAEWSADEDQQETDSQDDDLWTTRKSKKNRKRRFRVPDPPSKAAPPGPAYSPQTLSLLGFTQYYANLTRINNDFVTSTAAAKESGSDVERRGWKEGKHTGKRPHDRNHEPNPKKFEYEVLYDTREDDVYNMTDLTLPSYLDLAQRIGRSKTVTLDLVEDVLTGGGDGGTGSEVLDEEESDGDQEIFTDKSHGKSGKGRKRKNAKKHARKVSKPWFTFLHRAFVATVDEEQIEDQFGY